MIGVSVHFTKMFNHISPSLAADVAWYLGLRECDAKALIAPFEASKGAWRLGFNAVVPLRQRSRGLPQGLSTSVALAELVVSVYLWKVRKIALVETVGYIDDLHVLASSASELRKALALLLAFSSDLGLPRSEKLLFGARHVWKLRS